MRCELSFVLPRPSFQFADGTRQHCSVWNILKTTENCLDLSPIQFTPPTRRRQDSLVLSVSAVWTRHNTQKSNHAAICQSRDRALAIACCVTTSQASQQYELPQRRHFALEINHLTDCSFVHRMLHFYRATACNATHGNAVGILSVRLSVRCVYCDKTKWCTADILIPYESAITLLLWHQQWLVGDAPFPLKSALKVTHPPSKNADFDRFPLITSQPQEIAKKVQLRRI